MFGFICFVISAYFLIREASRAKTKVTNEIAERKDMKKRSLELAEESNRLQEQLISTQRANLVQAQNVVYQGVQQPAPQTAANHVEAGQERGYRYVQNRKQVQPSQTAVHH